MSDRLELGASDADSRWIGIRRHQVALAIGACGGLGDWVVRPRASIVEFMIGVTLMALALPWRERRTGAQAAQIGLRHLCQSRWLEPTFRGFTSLDTGGPSRVRTFQLNHRGRLDLSGADIAGAHVLAAFADALSAGEQTTHFSVHHVARERGAETFLCTPRDVQPPVGWSRTGIASSSDIGEPLIELDEGAPVLVRWRYLRTRSTLIAVLRVEDFSPTLDARPLLERLSGTSARLDVVLHVDVLGRARGQRLAARAVHRSSSDDEVSSAAGFRRTAQGNLRSERLRQRESLVAGGRALMCVAVYVVVRSDNLASLHQQVDDVLRRAKESGLRVDRGAGRQREWYRNQLVSRS